MANSKLIIVEGAQGAGKTTITDYLRDALKHTNLYRLNGISDSTITGYEKSKKMYENLIEYMKNMENLNINLVFDRTFFSEENYCRLGLKEYSFTEVYYELLRSLDNLDFEIYYITVFLEDEGLFEERLKREEKAGPEYAKYKSDNSIKQQKVYLEMTKEVEKKCKNIKVYTLENSRDINIVKSDLREIIGF